MTEERYIGVDGIKFSIDSGDAFSFDGVFSHQKRSGIELSFIVYGSRQEKEIENLLKKEKVTVEDPFAGRTYEASIRMQSSSFQVGKEGKSYIIEVKEIDVLLPFDTVEIDAITFQVLQYKESITSDKIDRHAVLKLSKEKFGQFRKLLERPFVQFRRIGIDDVPLELRFGGAMYWSRHADDGEEYFKQIVRLFPLDLEPSKLHLASGVTQSAMAHMLISLHARFELLVGELATNKVISEETQTALLTSRWRDLVPDEKINELCDRLEQVEDAEKDL